VSHPEVLHSLFDISPCKFKGILDIFLVFLCGIFFSMHVLADAINFGVEELSLLIEILLNLGVLVQFSGIESILGL
jgi:hypothetical protein